MSAPTPRTSETGDAGGARLRHLGRHHRALELARGAASRWLAEEVQSAWASSGIDTRRLTRRIRDGGAPIGVISHAPDGKFDVDALIAEAKAWPGLEGMDLAKDVTCRQTYTWDETRWELGRGFGRQANPKFKVVAIDYGAKRNILRCLADAGCA